MDDALPSGTRGLSLSTAAVATVALLLVLPGCGQSRRMSITIGGEHEEVASGTTLAQAAELFHVQPAAGSLLDVHGRVLRRGIFPGAFLLDGRHAASETRLSGGDRIELAPGHDRTEPLRRRVVTVPGGAPADPQFGLARRPGVLVTVRGAVSHELVAKHFRPTGRPVTPRAVALTFDDGPSPTETPRVLAVLRRLRVRATFFVIGYLVDAFPRVVRLEQRDGMTIGNHTYNHPEVPPFDELPPRLLKDEIDLGAQSLARLGVRPRLLRPPGGSFSDALVQRARALDERVVLWSVDPADWTPGITARQIVRRVLTAVRPGSIVILHDGGGDRSATIAALPAIVRGIRHRGLHLVALSGR